MGNRILILDEPTSVLTPDEADQVLGRLREMTRAGTLSVLLITHKLREVKAFAEVVSVLRRGRLVGEANIDDMTSEKLAELMVGQSEFPKPAQRVAVSDENTRLRIDALCAEDDRAVLAISDLSLAVRSGEILGVAGVSEMVSASSSRFLPGRGSPSAALSSSTGALSRDPGRNAQARGYPAFRRSRWTTPASVA